MCPRILGGRNKRFTIIYAVWKTDLLPSFFDFIVGHVSTFPKTVFFCNTKFAISIQ